MDSLVLFQICNSCSSFLNFNFRGCSLFPANYLLQFNAINEEKKIHASLHQKNERLKQFQKDVRKRVANAAQAHKRFIADSQSVKVCFSLKK